jgi:serralysin
MVLSILTDSGYDFASATASDDRIIMAQLPAAELGQLQSSFFPDVIVLSGGNDYLENDATGRFIFGNSGNDTLLGSTGNDTIAGGRDDDQIDGGAGNNSLFGNLGNDVIVGASGNDSLFGGGDNDAIIGGGGDDFLSGDRGFDTLAGGAGADQFLLASSADSRDVITDFQSGVDKIQLPGNLTLADVSIASNQIILAATGEVLAQIMGSVTTSDLVASAGSISGPDTSTIGQPVIQPAEVTPGDTPKTAGNLGVFSGIRNFQNFVGTTDLNDYYRFTLDQVHDIELSLFGMSQSANLQLYTGDDKPDGSVEISNLIETSYNYGDSDESIVRSLGEGTYFVRVYPESNNYIDTRYSLTFDATPTGILDAGDVNLGVLEGSRDFQNFVGTADPSDSYRFTLNGVRDLKLDLFGMDQDANVGLYVANQKLDGSWEYGNLIETSYNYGDSDESIVRSLGEGTYFVYVYPSSDRYIDTKYNLRLNATA